MPRAGETCVLRLFFRERDERHSRFDFTLFGEDERAAGASRWLSHDSRRRCWKVNEMMPIRVQYATLAELLAAGPGADDWLSPGERQAWQAMRSAERRSTWLAGRVLAKRLLREVLGLAARDSVAGVPSAIHIDSRSARAGHGERPRVFVSERFEPCAISIAHTSRRRVGCRVAAKTSDWASIWFADRFRCRATALGVHTGRTSLAGRRTGAPARTGTSVGHERSPVQGLPIGRRLCAAADRSRARQPLAIRSSTAARDLRSLQSWRIDGQTRRWQ